LEEKFLSQGEKKKKEVYEQGEGTSLPGCSYFTERSLAPRPGRDTTAGGEGRDRARKGGVFSVVSTGGGDVKEKIRTKGCVAEGPPKFFTAE